MTARAFFASLLLLAAMLAGAATPARAADYFGRPTAADQASAPAKATPPSVTLPAPLARALGVVVSWQTRMNRELRAELQDARTGASLRPVFAILFFSFVYGVVHAVGPGHGKVVVGGYFLTRRAELLHGLAMSGVAAAVQALSAIVLVGFLAAVLDVSTAAILDHAATLETISYGAIVLLGLWMAWGVVSGREHHHHHGLGHDHAHDHDHGHISVDGHAHAARRSEFLRILSTGAVVGLRPCSGAILVMLFSLANGILAVGILATFAMGAGVAITVSLVSLGTLGLHRSVAALGSRYERFAERGYRAVALGGALIIALFGAIELLAVWAAS